MIGETFPFFYEVVGVDLNADEERFYLEKGIGFCGGFADAAKQLEDSFGPELVTIKHLELAEFSSLLRLPSSVAPTMKELIAGTKEYDYEVTCNREGEVIE